MNKIIAFSLWGDNPKYTIGAVKNAQLAKAIYPDWIVRIYTANNVPQGIIENLIDLDVDIVNQGDGNWNSMFWRFLSADSNDIVLSRDTDSRLSYKEKHAVDDWLSGDKNFHIMRDHRCHAVPILGGMWGCRNGILTGISDMISRYNKGNYDNKWQVDQNFLKEIIYPLVKNTCCVHDEFFEHKNFPFPSFVGQAFNGDDTACL